MSNTVVPENTYLMQGAAQRARFANLSDSEDEHIPRHADRDAAPEVPARGASGQAEVARAVMELVSQTRITHQKLEKVTKVN